MCRTTPLLSTRFGAVSTVHETNSGRKVITPRHMMRRNLHRNCITLPVRPSEMPLRAVFRGAGTGPVMVGDGRGCTGCCEAVQPAWRPLLQGSARRSQGPARWSGRSSVTPPGLRFPLRPQVYRGLPADVAAPPVTGRPTAGRPTAPREAPLVRPSEGGRNHEWPPMLIRSSGPTAALAAETFRKSLARGAALSRSRSAGMTLAPAARQAGRRRRAKPESSHPGRRIDLAKTVSANSPRQQRTRYGYGHARTARDAGRAVKNVMQIALNLTRQGGKLCRFLIREICADSAI
jgi:hypothetical protein